MWEVASDSEQNRWVESRSQVGRWQGLLSLTALSVFSVLPLLVRRLAYTLTSLTAQNGKQWTKTFLLFFFFLFMSSSALTSQLIHFTQDEMISSILRQLFLQDWHLQLTDYLAYMSGVTKAAREGNNGEFTFQFPQGVSDGFYVFYSGSLCMCHTTLGLLVILFVSAIRNCISSANCC